jgi:hypothetical protein
MRTHSAFSLRRHPGGGRPRAGSRSQKRPQAGCLLLSLILGASAFVAGCANPDLVRVKPWERATLADYTMRPDRDPLHTAMAEHVYFSRESTTGGRGVGGSGCGCN